MTRKRDFADALAVPFLWFFHKLGLVSEDTIDRWFNPHPGDGEFMDWDRGDLATEELKKEMGPRMNYAPSLRSQPRRSTDRDDSGRVLFRHVDRGPSKETERETLVLNRYSEHPSYREGSLSSLSGSIANELSLPEVRRNRSSGITQRGGSPNPAIEDPKNAL